MPPAKTAAVSIPAIGVMDDTQKMTMTPAFADALGNPVPLTALKGVPVYASDDLIKVGLIPSADGSSCEVDGLVPTGLNPDGTPATVGVTCTGTNPDGTTAVIAGAVQVLAADAVGGSLAFGAPTTR